METTDDRRKRKLQALCNEYGLKPFAKKVGMSSGAIDQILKGVIGTKMVRPKSRSTESACRIEDKLGLGRGWFDWPFDGVDHRRYYALSDLDQAIVQGELKHAIKDCEARYGKQAAA